VNNKILNMYARQAILVVTMDLSRWTKNIAIIRQRNKRNLRNLRSFILLILIVGLLHIICFDLTSCTSNGIVYVNGYMVTVTIRKPLQQNSIFSQQQQRFHKSQIRYRVRNTNNNDYLRLSPDEYSIRDVQEEQTKLSLIQALLQPQSDLIEIQLQGKAYLPSFWRGQNDTVQCAILTYPNVAEKTTNIPALVLPLNDNQNQWKLLSYTYDAHSNQQVNDQRQKSTTNRPSRIVLLGLNAALMNRDGGLFDNLPYSTWTIDPERTNIDFANNPIASKFHMGKRRAYNRLLSGIDSYGYRNRYNSYIKPIQLSPNSPSSSQVKNIFGTVQNTLSNFFYPIKPNISTNKVSDQDTIFARKQEIVADVESLLGDDSIGEMDESLESLSKRILGVRLKELEMDIAEWDYQIALARADDNELKELYYENYKSLSQVMYDEINLELTAVKERQGDNPAQMTGSTSIEAYISNASDNEKNLVGTEQQSAYNSQYDSCYAMFREIIRDQLNAEVIGTALEQISLLGDDNSSVLGGVLILRRLAPKKKIRLAGEDVVVIDNDETYGNDSIRGGETVLIECQPDEAIGMHLACSSTTSLGLFIEKDLLERSLCMVRRKGITSNTKKINDALWETIDPEISILMEGQALNQSSTDRVAPVRIARTSLPLYDRMMMDSKISKRKSQLFPTDNPITSLQEYDSLSMEGKVRTLMTLTNFNGKLPRPRVLRTNNRSSKSVSNRDALDDLLLPLIDEAVRNQYLIREAMDIGDLDRVQELEQAKSKKQIALENAQQARQLGLDDESEKWKNEADFYSTLRADSTQDVGSYSRFLDSDEWYERQRQEIAKGVDKSKFGSLLDGIE
jgi:hypothetical protein